MEVEAAQSMEVESMEVEAAQSTEVEAELMEVEAVESESGGGCPVVISRVVVHLWPLKLTLVLSAESSSTSGH